VFIKSHGSNHLPTNLPQKKPQVLLPAAHHQLDCALITAGRLLPEEVQEEAKAQAAINASQILK
jgi:hypothetical protein